MNLTKSEYLMLQGLLGREERKLREELELPDEITKRYKKEITQYLERVKKLRQKIGKGD